MGVHPMVAAGILGVLAYLYNLLVGLQFLGDAFKWLCGRGAGGMFDAVLNPIAGLMVSILATALVQSYSTGTFIVVSLVSAGQISLHKGIPIIIGANIGTSVTNHWISMVQSGDCIMLQRAFAGATVHDMINFLTVLCLLPVEVIIGEFQGEGGPLYRIPQGVAEAAMDNGSNGDNPLKEKSPTKIITSLAKVVISNNKYSINALFLGAPEAFAATSGNITAGCMTLERRLSAEPEYGSRALLNRRLADGSLNCSTIYCVGKDMNSDSKKVSSSGYEKDLTKCEGCISEGDAEKCGVDKCYMDAGAYYVDNGSKGDNPLTETSPTKITTSLAKVVISNNKYIINAFFLGAPAAFAATSVNTTAGCTTLGRLSAEPEDGPRALLTRRLADGPLDCVTFYCVGKDLDSDSKQISSSGYEKDLTKCEGYISEGDAEKCGGDKCYMDAGAYYVGYVEERQIIKGGFVEGGGDADGGVIALIFSLLLLSGGLMGLCKILKFLVLGQSNKAIIQATKMNDYAAMLVGVVMTIIVESSSVATSSLTTLCGVGALSLEKMLPLFLGANIDTTATALIATLSSYTFSGIYIALCYLFFNIFGILIWFMVAIMRRVPFFPGDGRREALVLTGLVQMLTYVGVLYRELGHPVVVDPPGAAEGHGRRKGYYAGFLGRRR